MFGLIPYNSRNGLAKPESDFDRLFDLFNLPLRDALAPLTQSGSFKVDVRDLGEAYELTADLPGMSKDNVALSYENNYLTIEAKQEEKKDEKDDQGTYIRRERSLGSVSRSFYIDGIDEAKIHAEFKDGVLKVDMPKATVTQTSRNITIH